jgi:hypothetical protein
MAPTTTTSTTAAATPTTTTTAMTTKERVVRVHFGEILIRYYERIIDDNPSCIDGPPIGIGWQYHAYGSYSVNEWEELRGPRRKSQHLVLIRPERELMLQNLGYTAQDIAKVIRSTRIARQKRRQTILNLNAQPYEEAMESVTRKIRKLLALQGSSGSGSGSGGGGAKRWSV